MTHFYSRTGDDGFTGLLGNERVPKYHPRPEAVGTIDEATAAIGMGRALARHQETIPVILAVQRDLYHVMAEVSATPENAARFRVIGEERIRWLEEQIDRLGGLVSAPNEFILPGDSPAGAALALGRTIVRRAERMIAGLFHSGEIENVNLLRYLNRLSSLCFVLELLENAAYGQTIPTLAKTSD